MEEDQFNELIERLNDIQSDIPSDSSSTIETQLDEIIKLLKKIESRLGSIENNTSN